MSRLGRLRLRHSLKKRLVLLFLMLALATTGIFLLGMQRALSIGWRDAARPLVADYVDRLVAEIGSPPSVARAREMAARLPVTVRISGPQVNWDSQPDDATGYRWRPPDWQGDEPRLLARTTADGHRIELGLNVRPWHDRPRLVGWVTLGALLLLTAGAFGYVRHLLRPLDDIRAGAQRFGRGEFGQPIPVRRRDELGDLAGDVNTMAASIHQMLEAKRGLLLAISHELRSPITRARLHTELLPEQGEAGARREALLRDLQEMSALVADLLEGERLGQGHAALHLEPVDLAALVREVAQAQGQATPQAGPPVELALAPDLPPLMLDAMRMRLLLRNLLDNAQRHGGGQAVQVTLQRELDAGGAGAPALRLTVRDHGPGVEDSALAQLGQPFWRPDSARERATGGAGLGLYLCRLVAQAHGARLELRNAQPGLEVSVRLAAPPT